LVEHARYAAQSPVELDISDQQWEVTIRDRRKAAEPLEELAEEDKLRSEAPPKEPPVR
jgi:anti-sigma regulatory factor (Ser/Thr protein kinase)